MGAVNKQMQDEDITPGELKYLEVLLDKKQYSQLEQHCRNLLEKAPSMVSIHHLLGLALSGQHKYKQAIHSFQQYLSARPDFGETLINLAIAYEKAEDIENAVESYKLAIANGLGRHADTHRRLGRVLAGQGQWDQAILSFMSAAELEPEQADHHHRLGVSYNNTQQFEKALDSLLVAIQLNPNASKVHHDTGLVLRSLGRTEAALRSVKKAVDISPMNVNALLDLAGLHLFLGEFDEGFECYQRVLSLSPDNPAALGGLGAAHNKRGDHAEAIRCFLKALSRNPDMQWVKINFVETLSIYPAFPDITPEFVRLVVSCLEDPAVESAPLCGVSIRLLYKSLKPSFHSEPLIYPDAETTHTEIHQLLLAHLSNALLPNQELEDYLVRIRRDLLSRYASQKPISDTQKKILYALALQGHINEYVWFQTNEEQEQTQHLRNQIETQIEQGHEPEELALYLLGAYENPGLHYSVKSWGLNFAEKNKSSQLFNYIDITILCREREKQIAQSIDTLTSIDNSVSNAVRTQYEENPYPCWKSVSLNQHRPYIEKIATETYPNLLEVDSIAERPRVLIAGCGTGKHVLQSASGYKNASILAIDLSLASLAYAARKAEEYKISSITFAQADILQIGSLADQFDIIECGGVLHHMENPELGLKNLLPLLKPDGFLKLGLYSELARSEIVSLRNQVDVSSISSDVSQLRTFRHNLRLTHPEIHSFLTRVDDFSAASSMRDLLLHVQEHRFTIPQLKTLLEDNDLEFLGFAFRDYKVKKSYRQMYPEDPLCTNLDTWDAYEKQYPRTFGGMYQFWCAKKQK